MSAMFEDAPSGIVIPDVVGEVEGWRAWQIVGPTREPRLAGCTAGRHNIWPTRAWNVARCLKNREHNGRCPDESCSCGLYAAKTREQLVGLRYNAWKNGGPPIVIGKVGLVGKVIPGDQGWRAERGRVLELYVPHTYWRLVEPLRDAYLVPVYTDNTFKA